MHIITKTCLYNFEPLKPHFYIVKLGFTGVYIIFLIFAQNIDCGYSLEPPRRGGSNEYPQSMFWAELWKISDFLSENFHVLMVKFSVYLNRNVFVMIDTIARRTTISQICLHGRSLEVFFCSHMAQMVSHTVIKGILCIQSNPSGSTLFAKVY